MSTDYKNLVKYSLLGAVLSVCLICMPCLPLHAQISEVYTDAQRALRSGERYYALGLFSQAFYAYEEAIQLNQQVPAPKYQKFHTEAAFGKAKSALRMAHPEAEQFILDFITTYRPDPISNTATIELANFYFNSGEYDKAIAYYSTLRSADLDAEALSEVRFKQGYSAFLRKEFVAAETSLGEVRELKTKYYYPVNYYYGMCKFFREDYQGALTSFEKVARSEKYEEFVPYYITQIYFTQGQYGEVISYAEPKLAHNGVKNIEDMRLLLGRAYFETEDYGSALPYLETYASQAPAMRAEDFYQLAFTQYQAGKFTPAIENFKSVTTQESLLGQRANFYLADCYLKTGDLRGARTAFRNVSRMSFDESLRDEALLEYGKISSELKYDADAIQALDAIPNSSQWHEEAQRALRDIFMYTRDYATTLATLDSFSSLSPTLKEAHQQVSLYRGIQLMGDEKTDEADKMFVQVQKYPINPAVSAQALFWRAEISHQREDYERSTDFLHQYFTLVKTANTLPLESSRALANYTQGYNYLRQQNYIAAQGYFKDAITLLKQEAQNSGRYAHTVLPDAMLRAGDCAFKRNLYPDARRFYEEAIPLGGPQMVYAKYQRAIIEGLERKPNAKIRELEQMVIDHADSELADDVLLQLAIAYQETNNGSQAISVLQRLLDKYPNSDLTVPALLRLGLLNYNGGDINAALKYYKLVFKQQPTAQEGREALSALEEIYVQDLRTPDAYFDFVSMVPGYEITVMKKDSVSYRVAEIQYEQAEYVSAIKAFTEYLLRFPDGISVTAAYFYRGDAHAILKEYDDALRDFETVVSRGKSAYSVDALGRAAVLAYNFTKDFESAYTHYVALRELITDPAKRFETELGILRSAYRADKFTEIQRWSDAVTGNALASEMIRGEAYFYGAKSAFNSKEYDHAIERFNQVIKLSQNAQAAESRYRIAQIYYLGKQLDLAERMCHNANENNANYPYWVAKSLILLSDIAVDKHDLFNARAPLEAVIENFQGDPVITQEAQQKLEAISTLEKQQSRIQQDTGKNLQLQFIDDDKND